MGFKENLKEQLRYTGMFVKELAVLSGIKKQTIDSYLSSHNCIPSADAAVAIARALGVSVEYLVTGQEPGEEDRFPTLSPYPEVRSAAQIITQLGEKNRKMALAILKTMKKQEDLERK
ncbi:MAG: helix-turn-helix domain-containing protein [Treponema sp.]|jgi:transcriptional regulator with XRE-family HTH domain|nr:helix-turn-helix domain-containing protein [Treponema sp.]